MSNGGKLQRRYILQEVNNMNMFIEFSAKEEFYKGLRFFSMNEETQGYHETIIQIISTFNKWKIQYKYDDKRNKKGNL